jgi:hypothetical protein
LLQTRSAVGVASPVRVASLPACAGIVSPTKAAEKCVGVVAAVQRSLRLPVGVVAGTSHVGVHSAHFRAVRARHAVTPSAPSAFVAAS